LDIEDGRTVAAMDVLAPGIGEIIGGSQREERLDVLDARIVSTGLDPAAYGPRAPFTLTWGEKRLVAIAGVLVMETPHLVLDEPGAGQGGQQKARGILLPKPAREVAGIEIGRASCRERVYVQV
jgi:ABC-type branched-subunit amino acid transport system ATPase component